MARARKDRRRLIAIKIAKDEAKKILKSDAKYAYVVTLVKRLVGFGVKGSLCETLRIEPIEDFYELKLKWGLLGNTNLRVYFQFDPEKQEVVILKTYKKEDEGQTPRHIILNVQQRWAEYKRGLHRKGSSVYSVSLSGVPGTQAHD